MLVEEVVSPRNAIFHRLVVAEMRRETRDAVSIRFDVPSHLAEIFAFRAGQYLTLRAVIEGEDVRRNYSICAAPAEGVLRVAVKLLPGGRFSGYVGESLKPGMTVEVLPPAGHFTARFAPDRACRYAAFAAGSGITPILSIVATALSSEPQSRFTLFYGNRRSGDILFLEALAALKNRYMDRLEIYHFLSAEQEEIELFNGRLDQDKCRRILETLIDPRGIERCFICGPEGMMQAADDALRSRGVASERILVERFASPDQTAPSEAMLAMRREAAGRRIGVVLDGRTVTVRFDAALGNILDSVRAAGIAAPFACKGGVCATCRARIVSGSVDMNVNYGLTPDEVAQGYILTCQATPRGDDVVISYDI